MNERDRMAGLTSLLLRASWRRDAAAAALASAARDTVSTEATLRAIEATQARLLGAGRASAAILLDPAAMLRGVDRLAAIERLHTLAAERHDVAIALVSRRREASRHAQSRVDALERHRAESALGVRHEADRRAADAVDRQWLAMHPPTSDLEQTP